MKNLLTLILLVCGLVATAGKAEIYTPVGEDIGMEIDIGHLEVTNCTSTVDRVAAPVVTTLAIDQHGTYNYFVHYVDSVERSASLISIDTPVNHSELKAGFNNSDLGIISSRNLTISRRLTHFGTNYYIRNCHKSGITSRINKVYHWGTNYFMSEHWLT